jgi:glycosyltransferase involved in cell wall biosynthesis
MNVLLVCPTYPPNDVPCGVGDFTAELAPRLARRGASVSVAASTRHRGSTDGDVRVLRVATSWNRRAMRDVVAVARRKRFDVVNVQYSPELYGRGPWPKALPAWLALTRGPRVVLTAHTVVGGYPSARWLVPLLLAPARRIIAPSREVATLIARRLPMFRSRLREVPIGTNIPLGATPRELVRARVRAELGLGPHAPLVTHFGFAYEGKGIETLLAAVARLRERGAAITLLMIGGAWPGAERYYGRLQADARAAGLADVVRFAGHVPVDTVDAWLTASDVYAVPYDGGISARRGTLIAGLTHGLATVSTRGPALDPRFRDGENVLLVPPRDATALAEALARLLASPSLRAALGAGAAKLAPEFSWETIADATLGVYREALA